MDFRNIFNKQTNSGTKKTGATSPAPSEVAQQPWMEFTVSVIEDIKDLSRVKKELSKDKRAGKFVNTLLKLYAYFLTALEDKRVAISYQDKKYRYIGFINRRDNVFTFIVYPVDDEEIVKNDVNRKVRLSAQTIQNIDDEELKEATRNLKDNKQMYQIVAIAGLLLIGGGLFIYSNRSKPKPPPVMPVTTKPAVQPKVAAPSTLNPIQQKIALAVAETQCFSKLQKKLDELKKQHVIIKNLTVSTGTSPTDAHCSYNITENYTIPVVGSKLSGKYYEKTETGNVDINYPQFISLQLQANNLFAEANFVKCLKTMKSAQFKLLARPGVYQGEFAVNKNITPEAGYSTGSFLLALENICGFNLDIHQFQLTSKTLSGNFMLNWSESESSSTPQTGTSATSQPPAVQQQPEPPQTGETQLPPATVQPKPSPVPPKPLRVSPIIKIQAGVK